MIGRSHDTVMLVLKNAVLMTRGAQDLPVDLTIDDQGIVTEVCSSITASQTDIVMDLGGSYLSPGWIDMHTHVYHGVSNLGVRPSDIGSKTGVTVLNDAGTAGESTFTGLREFVIDKSDIPIYAFLNLSSTGLIGANRISELDSLDKIDIDATVSCIEKNRDIIKGIKVRASGVIFRTFGLDVLKVGRGIAREVGLPLMVHVGEPLPMLADILNTLDKGDILSHCYHGKRWGILHSGNVVSEAKQAWDRGVHFDVGHGEASLSFAVAEKSIAQGYKPSIISTDLHARNIDGPVFDLATTMSKMLALGMSLPEVVEAVTIAPAEILGVDAFQDGFVGKKARFTVFDVISRASEVADSTGERRILDRMLVPTHVVLDSRVIEAQTRFVPMDA